MPLQDFNKWEEQPRILTNEEINDPPLVVSEMFDYAHLPEFRNTLWEWLKTTLTGNFNKKSLNYKDQESLLEFYEKLLEASHLLLVAKNLTAPATQKSTAISANSKNDTKQQPAPARNLIPIIDKLVKML